MKHLQPFEALKPYYTTSTVKGELMVSCTYENLVQMLRQLIIGVEVDEELYLGRYPDIASAVGEGTIQSTRLHFVNDGYFEGRVPFPIHVNEQYYLSQNADVGELVRKGRLKSGQQHFEENGYSEGRLPFEL